MSKNEQGQELNFFDHLEWLKTLYVLRLQEINAADAEKNKIKNELNSKTSNMENLARSLTDKTLKLEAKVCDLENKLEIKEKEVDFLKSLDEKCSEVVNSYYKIPTWVRRIFVRE